MAENGGKIWENCKDEKRDEMKTLANLGKKGLKTGVHFGRILGKQDNWYAKKHRVTYFPRVGFNTIVL